MTALTPEGERLAAARAELESATNAAMIAAVRMVKAMPKKAVAEQLGVTRSTLDKWLVIVGTTNL